MSDESSGGGGPGPPKTTPAKGQDQVMNSDNEGLYSDRVKVTITRSERLKRNVLEINLESEAEAEKLDKDVMAKLFKAMGLRKEELEGYQLNGKSFLSGLRRALI